VIFYTVDNDPLGPIAAFQQFTDDTRKHFNISMGSGMDRMESAVDFHNNSLLGFSERSRALIASLEHAVKITQRTIDLCEKEFNAREHDCWNNRDIGKARKELDAARHGLIERIKQIRYFQRHAAWLIERFPASGICGGAGVVQSG
jgi:type I restriction enzyme M protein